MITPTKYMDVDYCLLKIIVFLIEILKKGKKILKMDELKDKLMEKINKNGSDKYQNEIKFFNGLSVLYLLGKIQYVEKTDSIELII